jgi:branched-chain amino acid transport system ATP-binding protein
VSLLEVIELDVRYGESGVLWSVDLAVERGGIVALVGANGAGKTTLMRAIAGLVQPSAGRIVFDGRDLAHIPAEKRVVSGVALVPEGRRLFAGLSVRENLMLGAFTRRDDGVVRDLERVWGHFPELKELADQTAGTLSGGQQQMCAIGRALMSKPRLLLVDEMSLGLAPVVVDRLAAALREVNRNDGVTILLVEQDVELALEVADRGYVLETGRIATSGDARVLLEDPRIREAYMGLVA